MYEAFTAPCGLDAAVREIIPAMVDRCLHVPALLTAKANRTPAGVLSTGIRLTGEDLIADPDRHLEQFLCQVALALRS